MSRYIAFLRAVNVGGRIVKMAQLKSIFESVGLVSVETFIASGNVIFSSTLLNVGVMHAPLTTIAQKAMLAFNSDTETFRTHEGEIYMLLHTPVTNSKFSITKFEKAIGAGTTFRNMNTMERLAKKYPAS